jgi:hypothetical protein
VSGCQHHGYMYWAGAGTGRCRYSFCSLCRTQRAAEAVTPGETLKTNAFLQDHTKDLKPEKSVSLYTTSIAAEYKSGKDGAVPRHGVIYGAAEDEFLSRFDTMLDLYHDTDRLQDAILGILEGSVRAAASRYCLTNDIVLDVRLLIEEKGIEAGVEKLLEYVARRERKAKRDAQKMAA